VWHYGLEEDEMEISIRQVDPADLGPDVQTVARLAAQIWSEHYTPIIGADQVGYMLESYHSAEAIADQIVKEGYRYWLAEDGTVPVAYCGAVAEPDRLFLSKLYVLDSRRRQGIAHRFVEILRGWCTEAGLPRIQLTVAKQNTESMAAYEKLGFSIVDSINTDIGSGFFMDDYVMEMPTPQTATLVLWRHGVTDWNAQHRFQGCNADVDLSDEGVAQSLAAAPGVARYDPDILVSSPMARARQTASAVEAILGRESIVDTRLKEIDVGAWSGLTFDHVMAHDPDYAASRRAEADCRQGGTGETAMELGVRVGAALRDWTRAGETTLIVCHGWALQMGVSNLMGWDYAGSRGLKVMGNCAVSVLTRTGVRWRIDVWNARVR